MHEKWLKHIDFIREHIDSMAFEDMAAAVGVTTCNLKLFLHQNKIFRKQTGRNLLLEMLGRKFGRPEYFHPNKEFYRAVGIGQRRFWQLYRGERAVTEKEYQNLALHLGVSLKDAFEVRQLSLLDDVHFRAR